MSQNHRHSYINILAKYLILTGIVYIVAMNVPSINLSKNELLMISVFVSLLVTLVDLYGDNNLTDYLNLFAI